MFGKQWRRCFNTSTSSHSIHANQKNTFRSQYCVQSIEPNLRAVLRAVTAVRLPYAPIKCRDLKEDAINRAPVLILNGRSQYCEPLEDNQFCHCWWNRTQRLRYTTLYCIVKWLMSVADRYVYRNLVMADSPDTYQRLSSGFVPTIPFQRPKDTAKKKYWFLGFELFFCPKVLLYYKYRLYVSERENTQNSG